ncbi:hypothetical protein [Nostoc sp. 'Lobaria pulmonaria (5183) cyanobiont']|uniref:hypothetical protein n=1 Tax=Nostoc sp. 'Lobaria pulmonaria (5183) cyanobiont' TaxID=1618022 RepID=UPI000CF319C6|nr:hypothetical protein [Nostoc sp. 'Lobaria pulmonaria (5183) cyanobiont']
MDSNKLCAPLRYTLCPSAFKLKPSIGHEFTKLCTKFEKYWENEIRYDTNVGKSFSPGSLKENPGLKTSGGGFDVCSREFYLLGLPTFSILLSSTVL